MKAFYFNAEVMSGKNEYRPAPSSEANNALPDIAFEQVFEGTTLYRKLFLTPEELIAMLVLCIGSHAPGYYLHAGTENDSDASVLTQWKGTGILESAIARDSVSLTVRTDASGLGFSILDLVRISDGVNHDLARIKSIAWVQNQATITLLPNGQLARGYAAGSTVSACVERARAGTNSVWVKVVIPQDARIVRNRSIEVIALM